MAKTGIRRNELITLDVEDVNFVEQTITLKATKKRTNRTVFIDDETAFILHRWLRSRNIRKLKKYPASFLNSEGDRMNRNGIYVAVLTQYDVRRATNSFQIWNQN